MALGGGSFISQDKILPGAYLNFVSASKADASLSDRGIVTMPLALDWGMDDAVFMVTNSDFMKYSRRIFGYEYSHDKLKGLRDLFCHCQTLYAYKLTSGGGKASNLLATARYSGIRGNDLSIVVAKNAVNDSLYDVMTYLDTAMVDKQTVAQANLLTANDFVEFQKEATLDVTAKMPLTGGTNHEADSAAHQSYLEKIESYRYHAMGVVTEDDAIKALYASFVKRMREEQGQKFQVVLFNKLADYEGVVSVKNVIKDSGEDTASLVYWVTGVVAGCAVNESNTNIMYDGEFIVDTDYTQNQLEEAIKAGAFVLHNVNGTVRVLEDINSFISTTNDKSKLFSSNQTIRVMDQIANDIAVIFQTKYLGKIPNDTAGRVSLWADIMKHHKSLADKRAIETVKDDDVIVTAGEDKKAVIVTDTITIVNAMEQLYMTITVE